MVGLGTVKVCGTQAHTSVTEHLVSIHFPLQSHTRWINRKHSADLSKADEEVGVRLGLELTEKSCGICRCLGDGLSLCALSVCNSFGTCVTRAHYDRSLTQEAL